MEMADRLPTMDGTDLKNLLANCRRLEQSGSPQQQAAAAVLVPLVEAELAGRKPVKVVAPKAPRKSKAKPKVAADEDAEEGADA